MASSPSPAFTAAKTSIDNAKTSPNEAFSAALKTIPAADQVAFTRWLQQTRKAEANARATQLAAQPALSPKDYVVALKKIDFRLCDSIGEFLTPTQIQEPGAKPPQLIPLGVDGTTKYFLRSELATYEVLDNYPLSDKTHPAGHPFLVEFRASNTASAPALKYALHLGALLAQPSGATAPQSTAFNVFASASDRSLWIVLDQAPANALGDRVALPVGTNGRKLLPSPKNAPTSFDVTRIATPEKVAAMDGGANGFGELFGTDATATAKLAGGKLAVPPFADVDKALSTARAGG